MDADLRIRIAAFNWLSEQVMAYGDVLPRKLLQQGFEFQNQRVPPIAPQGIFKPRILDLPISITTTPKGDYDDYFGPDNFLTYRYRGIDPGHKDNLGLRRVFEQKRPLKYFHFMGNRMIVIHMTFTFVNLYCGLRISEANARRCCV